MWKKFLIVGATLALLIAIVVSEEDTSTQRPKPKRYRIVKMYGRRLKPKSTTTTTTTTPAPVLFGPPIKIRGSRNESSEEKLQRDMLYSNYQSSENVVNVGEMDLQNFDVAKILAAAGHNANGDPNAPTIVRFSAPSSDSHLDPAYLRKLISEQLGGDAQFQILPPSNIEHPKPGISNAQSYSSNNIPQQELRGGFKQVFPPAKQQTNPELSPDNSKVKFSSQWSKPLYESQNSKEQHIFQHTSQNTNTPPSPQPKLQYKNPTVQQQPVTQPPSFSLSTKSPTKTWPLYPRNPAPAARPTTAPAHYYTTKYTPNEPTSPPPQPKPFLPPSPPSQYESISPPSQSQYKSFSPTAISPLSNTFYNSKPIQHSTPTYTVSPSPPAQSFKISSSQQTGQLAPLSTEDKKPYAYSTLSQAMTPPGFQPAVVGQYGPGFEQNFESNGNSGSGSKYSTTFVRGFVDDDTYLQQQQQHQVSYNKKPTAPQNQWKTISPTLNPPEGVNIPSQSFTLPIPPSQSPYQQEVTGTRNSDFHYQNNPSKSSSQNYESYVTANEYVNHRTPRGQGIEDYVRNSEVEYGPPIAQPLVQKHSSEFAQNQIYGQNSQQQVTKTIYVNLPPESPTSTTPKPYHHVVLPQKHYKIVFIKAPTAPPPEEPEIQVTPAPETKTIIYVLHKKPEPPKKIVITPPPPTKPSAPEVFFVQYKDKNKEKKQGKGWDDQGQWDNKDQGGIWDRQNMPDESWDSSNQEEQQWDDNNSDTRESWGSQYTPSNIDTTNNWSPIYAKDKSDTAEEDIPSYENDRLSPLYDMSSSSSTVHVNVRKSISDEK